MNHGLLYVVTIVLQWLLTYVQLNMCLTTDSEREFMSKIPYREIVDALLWCSTVCRPDLFYAVIGKLYNVFYCLPISPLSGVHYF